MILLYSYDLAESYVLILDAIPPFGNAALLGDYQGTMMVNNPSIEPYFLGGKSDIGGVVLMKLTRHVRHPAPRLSA